MVSRKSFCEFKRTDVKVCLALASTSGLSAVLFLISHFLINDHSTSIPLLLTSIGTVAEQLLLLIIPCKKVISLRSEEIRICMSPYLCGCVHM